MANVNILGAIGVQDSDYVALHTYGVGVVYDAFQQILGNHNDDMAVAERLFIEGDTPDHQMNYKLTPTGRFQRRGSQSRAGAVKVTGQWSVGFPLEDFGAEIQVTDVDWAYMTAAEFNHQMGTVLTQDTNTRRFEMLRALFNSGTRTFNDPRWPAITVQPLANSDGQLYPPVIGSEVTATQNNYLGLATAATTISDSANPIPTIVNQLEQMFGTPTGGSQIVIFCNNAQTAGIQNLAGFDTVPNRFVTYGANASLVIPTGEEVFFPGRLLGETDSALIVEWRWIPANYLFGIHYGAPKPLMRRVDPKKTGLTTGLQMTDIQNENPFLGYSWRNRFGFGVGNRLNGVAMDLTTGSSTYTIPTAYA